MILRRKGTGLPGDDAPVTEMNDAAETEVIRFSNKLKLPSCAIILRREIGIDLGFSKEDPPSTFQGVACLSIPSTKPYSPFPLH